MVEKKPWTALPLGGQKGLVEEKIYVFLTWEELWLQTKALAVVEPVDATVTTKAVKFENQHQNQLFN
jgi:electron transfer flavoprotein beta subunit